MSFLFPQKVLFKHCDPAGIVFYPRYFEILNDCIEAFFDSIGIPFEGMMGTGGVPTVQIMTRFHAPSRHGDHLVLTLDLTKIGKTSLDIKIVVRAGQETRLLHQSTLVRVDKNGVPTPWTDTQTQSFQPHFSSEA